MSHTNQKKIEFDFVDFDFDFAKDPHTHTNTLLVEKINKNTSTLVWNVDLII